MKYLFALLMLIPFAGAAQLQVNGRVVNADNSNPIPDASIFLNNTTTGTKAAADGSFKLYNLRSGQYDLIVTVVGYQTHKQTITVSNNTTLPVIKMAPKTMMMNEVVIGGGDPKRARKLRLFKDQFLGRSSFADQCEIANPETLILKFSNDETVLSAYTNDFLEITNNYLGYKLRYIVNNFVLDRRIMSVAYEGYVSFEELEGSAQQKRKWAKNRGSVYYGSPTHFLREILANRLDKDYMVRPFCFKSVDENKVMKFDTLKVADYVHKTDQQNIFAVNYPGNLDVFYYPPGIPRQLATMGRETGNRGQVGSIDFIDNNIFFDINGTILNPTGAFFKYQWGSTRVAQLLPVDYWP